MSFNYMLPRKKLCLQSTHHEEHSRPNSPKCVKQQKHDETYDDRPFYLETSRRFE